MIIQMSRFGTALTTRQSGRAAFHIIEKETGGFSEAAIFDFEGVDSITNSFADEVFGKIVACLGIDRMRETTHFANVDHFSSFVIRNAIGRRAGLPRSNRPEA